ncbi:MAG: tig, Trigger factor [Candidatus Saccharibacteria bacterium]|nr:tig, Trigger factor [Candidatus Saccharibacteria bacterium]
MKTTIKQLSDTKVSVTITLDKKELDDAEQVALTKLSKKVKAPGFRAGKVPASVAAKHVNPEALAQQTLDDALSKAVSQAFTDEKIQALDRPEVDVKKFVPGQELEFIAEAEILPKITLGDYKKLGVKKNVAKVTKADIDDVIERMRKGLADKKETDRAAKDGDETVIDFVGKKDGVAFDGGTADDYTLTLGSNQFIPGFEEGVVGHKAGDVFDINVTFPSDYHAAALAGAPVVFTVTLKTVKEIVLPKLDAKLAAKAGPFKTVEELTADIKRELEANKEREAVDTFKDELVSKLIEVSTVPVPQILVNDQSKSIEQDMTQNLMYQGMTLDMYLESKKQTKDEWLADEVKTAAENRVKAGLVLAELSKVANITATNEELAEKIQQYQEQYGNKANQDFTTPELQRDVANRLLTDKTLDYLVELNS